MEHYGLSEEDCNQQISDLSLEDIAHSSCRKWRDLPSRLVLPGILVEDIDRSGTGEGEKRLNFFREWKQMRGFDATYKRLIEALLDIHCREDAEVVCRLLRDLPYTQQPPTLGPLPLSHTTPTSILIPEVLPLTQIRSTATAAGNSCMHVPSTIMLGPLSLPPPCPPHHQIPHPSYKSVRWFICLLSLYSRNSCED